MDTPVLHSKIYPATEASAPTLLILHGLLGLSDNWACMARRYSSAGITTHTLDLPCHGRSHHIEVISLESFARQVHRYIVHHSLEKVMVLGHSLGGKVAMELSCRYPKIVERLIIADISPEECYSSESEYLLSVVNEVALSPITSRDEAHEFLFKKIGDEALTAFLLKSLYRLPDGNYDFRFDRIGLAKALHSMGVALDDNLRYNGKTLVLRSDTSGYVSPAHKDKIIHHFEKADIYTIKDAGHWLHADAPEKFFSVTSGFLLG